MRTAPRLLLGLCLTAGTTLGSALPAVAAPASGTVIVKPMAEGWYRTAPACTLPTGCAPASSAPSQYPPGTLHVGVQAGFEEARTYLQLDLGLLPAGTKPTGGTLLLPVASSADGTRAANTAKMQACAVTGEVTDVEGSFATPPKAECEKASVPATFVPAAGTNPAAFTVDLAKLTATWDGGATPGAVALLPAKETSTADNWHVAFSQRKRTGTGVVPISASLSVVSAALGSSSDSPPVVEPPPFEPAPATEAAPPSFDSGTTFAAPALTVDAPLVPQPLAQAAPAPQAAAAPVQQQVVPAASVVTAGFRYPAVFLLPLLLALAVGWLGRALTRDLVTSA